MKLWAQHRFAVHSRLFKNKGACRHTGERRQAVRAAVLEALPGARPGAPQHQALAEQLPGVGPAGVQVIGHGERVPLLLPVEALLCLRGRSRLQPRSPVRLRTRLRYDRGHTCTAAGSSKATGLARATATSTSTAAAFTERPLAAHTPGRPCCHSPRIFTLPPAHSRYATVVCQTRGHTSPLVSCAGSRTLLNTWHLWRCRGELDMQHRAVRWLTLVKRILRSTTNLLGRARPTLLSILLHNHSKGAALAR
jgi:hypothetical protein